MIWKQLTSYLGVNVKKDCYMPLPLTPSSPPKLQNRGVEQNCYSSKRLHLWVYVSSLFLSLWDSMLNIYQPISFHPFSFLLATPLKGCQIFTIFFSTVLCCCIIEFRIVSVLSLFHLFVCCFYHGLSSRHSSNIIIL